MVATVHGRRVLVTGGASGIGLAIAELFHSEGADVAVLDRAEERPTVLPSAVHYVSGDLGAADSVQAAVTDAARLLGGIDSLVNNAGVGARGTVCESDDAEWHRVLNINVVGTARVTRETWPHLREAGGGSIVNIASAVAAVGLPDRAVYSASKGAVVSLTRAMAADGVPEGIRVNAVNPGTVDTPWVQRLLGAAENSAAERAALEARQPHGRLVTAREIATAVLYLSEDGAGSVTGTVLTVDGGLTTLRMRT